MMASPFNRNNEIEANIRSLLRDSPRNRHGPSPSRNNPQNNNRVINSQNSPFPADRQFVDPRNAPRYSRTGQVVNDPRYNFHNAPSNDTSGYGSSYGVIKPLMSLGNYNYPHHQPYYEHSGGFNNHGNGPQRIIQNEGRNKGNQMKNSPQKMRCDQQIARSNSNGNDKGGMSKKKNAQDANDTLVLFDDPKVKELEKERIFILRKRSMKFPNAKFFCRLCDFHCFSYDDTQEHIVTSAHVRRKDKMLAVKKLEDLPQPTEDHLIALARLVKEIYDTHGMTDVEMAKRKNVAKKLQDFVHKEMPVCDVDLYGSSLSGFGLKNADVNIDLIVTSEKVNPAITLKQLFLLLRDKDIFSALRSDFSAKVPAIYFEDSETKLICQVTVNCCRSCLTNKLLAIYSRMDPRVLPLAATLKYWAKICKVDRQDEGTLPSYCMGLLVVYFLQKVEPPVLPVLSETVGNGTENIADTNNLSGLRKEAASWKSNNTMHLGALWLGLLKFYTFEFDMMSTVVSIKSCNKLDRKEKKWSSKKFCIEDPFVSKRNVARSLSNTRLFEYVYDALRRSYFYFGTPQLEKTDKKIDTSSVCKNGKNTSVCCKKSSNNQKQHTSSTDCAEIHNKTSSVTTSDSGPDLCLTSSSDTSSENIEKDASHLLDTSSTSSTSDNSSTVKNITPKPPDELYDCDYLFLMDSTVEDSTNHKIMSQKFDALDVSNTTSESSKCSVSSENSADVSKVVNVETSGSSEIGSTREFCENVSDSDDDCAFAEGKYSFEFAENYMTDGKGPAIICGICEKDGHLKSACPEEKLPELVQLPDMKQHKSYLKLITSTLKQVPRDFAPSEKEYQERDCICRDLEHFIKDIYPLARLHLFGSSCNGFGFQHSDLDICVTFSNRPTPEDLDYTDIIETLCKKLKKHPSLYNVFPIPTAKVPIVKFKHRESQLEGDISLYNTLAQQNTRLMKAYALIDTRVRTLGYSVKVFAKICDIGDASRGSLSSYAFILLVIHYLQQCKPPVIPVLQELYEGKKPEIIIDGWNAWFYDDINNLSSVWSDFGKNNQSIGELWVGFFKYYTEIFNYKDQVVCIRQKEPLSRFEKFWNGSCIAIEDPFDLNHNLGAGLSRKMNIYIMKAVHNGRNLYGVPVSGIPSTYQTPGDYFFDSDKLTDGTPPTDRCCKACGKIGHIAKECPIVISRKEREMKEKKFKEEKQQRNNQSPQKGASKTMRSLSDGTGKLENNVPGSTRRSMSVPEDKSNNATTTAEQNRKTSHALPSDTKTVPKVATVAQTIKNAQQLIGIPPCNTYASMGHFVPLSNEQSNFLNTIMKKPTQEHKSSTPHASKAPNTSVSYPYPCIPVVLNPPGLCVPGMMGVQRPLPLLGSPQSLPHFTVPLSVSVQNSPIITSAPYGQLSQKNGKNGEPLMAVASSHQRHTQSTDGFPCTLPTPTTNVLSSSANDLLSSSSSSQHPSCEQQNSICINSLPVNIPSTNVSGTETSASLKLHYSECKQPLPTGIKQQPSQLYLHSTVNNNLDSPSNDNPLAVSTEKV